MQPLSLATKVKEKHICYIVNTCPILKNSTLLKAINIYKKLNFSKYDSLNTFETVRDFLWDKKKPINYKLGKSVSLSISKLGSSTRGFIR